MAPVLATLLIVAGLSVFAWILSFRVRPLLFARPDVRWDDAPTRTEKLLLYGFGQKRMPSKPERPAGAAHIWIFIAFIVAQLGTLTSFGLAYDPAFHLPFLAHESRVGQVYLQAKEGVQAMAPLNPFLSAPFGGGAMSRLFGLRPSARPEAPAAAPPNGGELAALRKELEALKASLKKKRR